MAREDCCFVLFLLLSGSGFGADQSVLDYIGRYLTVKYDVISNVVHNSAKCEVTMTFKNVGPSPIRGGDWIIYFSHIRFIEKEHVAHNPAGYAKGDFIFGHENGVLFWMKPGQNFADLSPDQERSVTVNASDWMASRTDVMPNWYVTGPGLEPRTIASTAGQSLDFVGDFDSAAKWKRYPADQYDPYTLEQRYDLNQVTDRNGAVKRVIPTPVKEELMPNGRTVNMATADWVIFAPEELQNETNILSDKTKFPTSSDRPTGRYIELSANLVHANNEAYQIEVDPETPKIVISGSSQAGVFYGIQTLLALLSESHLIPEGRIEDHPRFTWRGLHYDIARNYHGKDAILELLEVMGMYKLNHLHLHLVDDEGWRVEIPGLEELTEVGGQRCHDLNETKCIISQLGSGPSTGTSGSGYLTVEDYREVLRFAVSRHITVIPEFNMPGHAHAVIKAMRARYKKYIDTDLTKAEQYLLDETDDPTQYLSVQSFTDNAINPCINSTYAFVEKLVSEVKALHAGVQPLEIFHFGGDEVAATAWLESPSCIGIVENTTGASEGEKKAAREKLKELYVRGVARIVSGHGLSLAGWEDGLMGTWEEPFNLTEMGGRDVYVNPWDNIWEWGRGNRTYTFANAGYKVVLSHATHLYYDMPYEPDPEERGYYWATRFTSTKKTFGYIPDSVYDNIDVKRNGEPITKDEICISDENCPRLERPANIIGMQGHVWGETIRTQEQLFYMLFPRMVALAERAWHKASWEDIEDKSSRDPEMEKDWEDFANTLGYRELGRLDDMGVTYRVSVPGVKASSSQVNSAYPGLIVQYSTDGGATWADYKQGTQMEPGTSYHFETRSVKGNRRSRRVSVDIPPQPASAAQHAPWWWPLGVTSLILSQL